MSEPTNDCCPICGAALHGEAECTLCRLARAPLDAAAVRLLPCRQCGTLLAPGVRACDACLAGHPTSYGGMAPVAQLALGFSVLAIVLLILNLCFGPLV